MISSQPQLSIRV